MVTVDKSFIKLPSRDNITNKGDAGHVLVVGGDIGMCGAAAFASEAAYRMGCGLVRAYIHPENRIPFQTLVPEAVLTFWEEGIDTPVLDASLEWADAVVIGVGFGKGEVQKRILKKVISSCAKPIVIDADGLNILAMNKSLISKLSDNVVLTPHLAELSRLTDVSVGDIKKNTVGVMEEKLKAVTVAAKSNVTVIRLNSGETFVSSSGNSSLSTGGTGDILAGMLASLLAQEMPIDKAVPTAVFLHGEAGVCAGERLGERSVMARDVINFIPEVLLKY